MNCTSEYNCPVEATIGLIGGKYKAVLLWHLMGGKLRYSELHKRIPRTRCSPSNCGNWSATA